MNEYGNFRWRYMAKKNVRNRKRRNNRGGMAIIACVVLVFCVVLMLSLIHICGCHEDIPYHGRGFRVHCLK